MSFRPSAPHALVAAALALTLTSGVTAQAPAREARPAAAQRSVAPPIELLEVSLQSLADRSRHNRRVGGYVMLGLGGATVVGGATTLALSPSDEADIVGYSLMGGAPCSPG